MTIQQEHKTKHRTNKPNHEYARYSIRYQIPKVTNSTPMEIPRNITTQVFKDLEDILNIQLKILLRTMYHMQNCYSCSRF